MTVLLIMYDMITDSLSSWQRWLLVQLDAIAYICLLTGGRVDVSIVLANIDKSLVKPTLTRAPTFRATLDVGGSTSTVLYFDNFGRDIWPWGWMAFWGARFRVYPPDL